MMEPLSNDPRSQASIPPTGRLAGIDFGTVRIGIALTDPSRIIASPLETYTRQNQEQDRDYFVQLVESEGVVAFLVGLPVHMSGDESQKSQEAREFAQWLQQVTGLPVGFVDERLSTKEARQRMIDSGAKKKLRRHVDSLAAQLILQHFLENQ